MCSSEVCTATERDRYEKSVSISSHLVIESKRVFVHTCIIIRYEMYNHSRIEINCFWFIEQIQMSENETIVEFLVVLQIIYFFVTDSQEELVVLVLSICIFYCLTQLRFRSQKMLQGDLFQWNWCHVLFMPSSCENILVVDC